MPWTADAVGRIDGFSPRWMELTGRTRDELLGEGWTQAPHPDDLPAVAAAWTHAVATGEPCDIEYRVRLHDGSYHWMRSRAYPWRDPDTGAVLRWYGTTEDVDERRRAEGRLRESDARLTRLLDTTPAGVVELDAEGRVTYAKRRGGAHRRRPAGRPGRLALRRGTVGHHRG